MNNVVLVGRLTKNPELRYIPVGGVKQHKEFEAYLERILVLVHQWQHLY